MRLYLIYCFLLVIVTNLYAEAHETKLIQRNYKLQPFEVLDLQTVLNVEIYHSDSYHVVAYFENVEQENAFVLHQHKDKVTLFIKEASQYHQRNSEQNKICIYTPHCSKIIQQGEVNVIFKDSWVGDSLICMLSGISKIEGTIQTNYLALYMNGIATISINGKCNDAEIIASGGSRAQGTLLINNHLNLDLSGASKLNITGKSETMSLFVSGSSKVTCRNFICKHAQADCSGCSSASVYVSETLKACCSGIANFKYYGNCKVISSHSTQRSSIKRQD